MGPSDSRDYDNRPFYSYSKSFSFFIDIGGNDTYLNYLFRENTEELSGIWKNNSSWRKPENNTNNCFGIGIDIE